MFKKFSNKFRKFHFQLNISKFNIVESLETSFPKAALGSTRKSKPIDGSPSRKSPKFHKFRPNSGAFNRARKPKRRENDGEERTLKGNSGRNGQEEER